MQKTQEATQEIYVLNKKLRLRHSAQGFKTSMDTVFLAAACNVKAGQRLLDMGCGVGGAGLCVLSRVSDIALTGVEVQEEHAALARHNAQTNGFGDACDFIHSDIRDYKKEKYFDHAICNPPFLEAGKHLRSPSVEKATAMGHEKEGLSLQNWIDAAYHNLKSKGSLTFIYPVKAMDTLICGLENRFGAIEVFPLWSKQGEGAKRVIIRAVKDRKSNTTLHSGLVLHEENGEYTQAANKILRDNAALQDV